MRTLAEEGRQVAEVAEQQLQRPHGLLDVVRMEQWFLATVCYVT